MISLYRATADYEKAQARHLLAVAALTTAILRFESHDAVMRLVHATAGSDNEVRRTKQTLARIEHHASTIR